MLQEHRFTDIGSSTVNSIEKLGKSQSAEKVSGASDDELHVVVVDEDGTISGSQHTVLETYGFLSCATDGKDPQGVSSYYKQVINAQSDWVWWTGHTTDTHMLQQTVLQVT